MRIIISSSFVALLLLSGVAGIPDPDNGPFCPGALLGEPGGDDGIVNGKCMDAGECRYSPFSCDGEIFYADVCTCPADGQPGTYACLNSPGSSSDCIALANADVTDTDFRNDPTCPIAQPLPGASCSYEDDIICRYNDACPEINDARAFQDSCECLDNAIVCAPTNNIDCLELQIVTCPPFPKPLEDQLCNFRQDLYCLYGVASCPEVARPTSDDLFAKFNCTCTDRTNGESRITCDELPNTCTGEEASNSTCPTSTEALSGGNFQCEGRCNYSPFLCTFPGSTPSYLTSCDCLDGPDFGLICAQSLPFCEDPGLSSTCPMGTIPVGGGICICFSGESAVETLEKGSIFVQDLAVGDFVLTADNKYERVYSFGHYKQTGSSEYLMFNNGLQISHSHMLAVQGRGFVPASTVNLGEQLVAADGSDVLVESIQTVTGTGMFAPFTPSGTIVMNGIVASTFVSMQGESAELVIAGVSTGLTWHWLAHTFELPHRLFASGRESYDENGLSNWVAKPLALAMWLERQHDAVSVLVWIPILVIVSLFAIFDAALIPVSLLLAAGGAILFQRRQKSKSL